MHEAVNGILQLRRDLPYRQISPINCTAADGETASEMRICDDYQALVGSPGLLPSPSPTLWWNRLRQRVAVAYASARNRDRATREIGSFATR
jgi:hypothetical protein